MPADAARCEKKILQAARLLFDVGYHPIGAACKDSTGNPCELNDPDATYYGITGAIDLVTLGDDRDYRWCVDACNWVAKNIHGYIDCVDFAERKKNLSAVIELMMIAAHRLNRGYLTDKNGDAIIVR